MGREPWWKEIQEQWEEVSTTTAFINEFYPNSDPSLRLILILVRKFEIEYQKEVDSLIYLGSRLDVLTLWCSMRAVYARGMFQFLSLF